MIHKVYYYGENLSTAFENCMQDSGTLDDEKEYKVISCKLLLTSQKVEFTKNLCELWEFKIVLIP